MKVATDVYRVDCIPEFKGPQQYGVCVTRGRSDDDGDAFLRWLADTASR